jgi:hypothetical protein
MAVGSMTTKLPLLRYDIEEKIEGVVPYNIVVRMKDEDTRFRLAW